MKKLLLFDIDGTLLRAEHATRTAINETFTILFNPTELIESLSDSPFFAMTDLGLFRDAAIKMIGRPLTDKEYAAFVKIYAERLREQLKTCKFYLMPGIAELLPRLEERENLILGLETGNHEAAANLKLDRAGIRRARRLDHGPLAEENIYVIGDAPHDIIAGKKAGVNTIAVGTGTVDQTKVLAENPDNYFKDLTDVAAFLRCIGENDERN